MTRLDVPQNTISDLISHFAVHNPDKLAVVSKERRLTWGEFNLAINRVANRLLEAGIARGDRVAIVMGSTPEHLTFLLGAVRAGASAVPISTMLSAEQIAALVCDAEAAFLFTDSENFYLVKHVAQLMKTLREDGFFLDRADGRWRSFHDWLDGAPDEDPRVEITLDDEFAISYSSGTTGSPKGVVYSHRARQMMGLTYAVEMNFDRNAISVATTPLYSNGTSIMLFPTLAVGGTIILMNGFTTSEFLDIVQREHATHTLMVPTQYIRLLEEPALSTADFSSMKVFLTAGSPMRPDTKADVLRRLGPRLYEVYGFSEGGVTIMQPGEFAQRPNSVGQPVIGFEMRILDPDSDRELPRGEIGEIAFYGGWSMLHYQNDLARTEAIIWRDTRGRRFLRTGDIGKIDEAGYAYVVDRKKDMIISGGFNVFPADIEAVIGGHEAVRDVAVIGVPHPLWGETPVAFVIAHAAGASPTAEALATWSNGQLAKNQRVSEIHFVDEFPRNALGKVIKAELRCDWEKNQKPSLKV